MLSVDIEQLVTLTLNGDGWKKDREVYEVIIEALKHVKSARDWIESKDFENAAKYADKAFKVMNEFVASRQNSVYEILLAPFHYYLGNILTTYIEERTDEFGNLKELNYVSDDENEDDYDEEEEEEDESGG